MNDYWHMIPGEHQQKLRSIAARKSVSPEIAMRNIVNFLKEDRGSL